MNPLLAIFRHSWVFPKGLLPVGMWWSHQKQNIAGTQVGSEQGLAKFNRKNIKELYPNKLQKILKKQTNKNKKNKSKKKEI